jgi:hypothetical protein
MEIKDNLAEIAAKRQQQEVQEEKPETKVPEVLSKEEKRAADQEHIMQYFAFEMLREPIRAVAEAFYNLANAIEQNLPRNPERTVALRKLLESKDAAIRAIFG